MMYLIFKSRPRLSTEGSKCCGNECTPVRAHNTKSSARPALWSLIGEWWSCDLKRVIIKGKAVACPDSTVNEVLACNWSMGLTWLLMLWQIIMAGNSVIMEIHVPQWPSWALIFYSRRNNTELFAWNAQCRNFYVINILNFLASRYYVHFVPNWSQNPRIFFLLYFNPRYQSRTWEIPALSLAKNDVSLGLSG